MRPEINIYNKNEPQYEFRLIYSGTRDGYARSEFEDRCYNINQTVTIMKIKETGELIGGYNPVCWNIKGRPPNDYYSIETDKSFIFKVEENQMDNLILSRVVKPG